MAPSKLSRHAASCLGWERRLHEGPLYLHRRAERAMLPSGAQIAGQLTWKQANAQIANYYSNPIALLDLRRRYYKFFQHAGKRTSYSSTCKMLISEFDTVAAPKCRKLRNLGLRFADIAVLTQCLPMLLGLWTVTCD
jgi:hypothetical protein